MPRRSRKQLVGKIENCEIYIRAKELADLERSLHRTWRWCGNTIMPIRNTASSYINKSSGRTNLKEAS